ncbi:MFS transporter [Skermanella stibiiresistens SB22]|uniref:MFS transporter n=1 Tax=Skermanella stibiiresistens SB22 TaxID=1385369 RepID=W9H170_9PROT|nr:MFS transporter [Skermanella stibiiresistens]EWY39804.1 MFS transporter [Skermanella stibiiresistens SB22]
MGYLAFIAAHGRMLAFGFLLTLFSSFGQTFFISLSGGHIREDFALSNGEFGLLYSIATLGSATALIWAGRWIDTVALPRYVTAVVLALTLACVGMATAGHPVFLALAIFGLRLAGQGLMPHTAFTTMARRFDTGRGTALSLVALGHPTGEALLPTLMVAALAVLGWRSAWIICAAALLVVVVPSLLALLRADARATAAKIAAATANSPETDPATSPAAISRPIAPRDWTRAEVLRDPRFYLLLPALLAPGFINTGVFFHQIALVEAKGWAPTLFAASFAIYAGTTIATSLTAGPLIDRVGAVRLMPVYLLPLAAALAVLSATTNPLGAASFMALAGVTAGISAIITAAVWAELYGTRHLGAIRSLSVSISVLSTALSPGLFGWLIDHEGSFDGIAAGSAAGVLAASLLTLAAVRRHSLTAPGGRSIPPS